jgi:branched-subunit amino acid transport protein
MSIWWILLGGMAVTYLTRLSFIALVPQGWQPEAFKRGLRFVAPAVLSALILPQLLVSEAHLTLSPANPRLIAAALAAVVGWRTRNTWLTIATGMVCLWLIYAVT